MLSVQPQPVALLAQHLLVGLWLTRVCLFQRQKEMVKMLYNETMALEELLEEAVNTLGPDARDILAQIRCGPAALRPAASLPCW